MNKRELYGKTIKYIVLEGEKFRRECDKLIIYFTDNTSTEIYATYDWNNNESYVSTDFDGDEL